MASRLLWRLRRRAKRGSPTWRIVLSDGARFCQEVEVVRTYWLTRQARALMCQACTHFEIAQVCSWLAI